MLGSLQSGLSGMNAHLAYLDVIGNNLANSNTTGFKTSRITFDDMFSQTLRNVSPPTGTMGGTNAVQMGTGVNVGSLDMIMTQGAVLSTGRPFDLGIEGEGFFAVSNGSQTFYTRSGTFGIDSADYMVDLATGFRVQNPTLQDIQLDISSTIAPTATTELELAGTLPAEVTGPLQEVVMSNVAFADGLPAELTGTNTGPFTLIDGDEMSIRVNGSASQDITFTAADFTAIGSNIASCTAADVATVINNMGLVGFTASDSGGALVLTTENTGDNTTLDIDNEVGSPATTLGLGLSMVQGSESEADETTLLNDLTANKGDYVDGDLIRITGTSASGLSITADFVYGAANDGTTLGELRDFISSSYSDATCEIDTDGNLVITADDPGEANLSLFMQDDETATGTTLWPNYSVSTDGTDADTVVTSVSLYDDLGLNHTLVMTFTRSSDSDLRWEFTAQMPDVSDAIISNNISSVQFNNDGSFNAILGTGSNIEIYYPSNNSTQSVNFDFGQNSTTGDGLRMAGTDGSVLVESQNGYALGELAAVTVETDGGILGHYTNGQFVTLDQVALAQFTNKEGLLKQGESLYTISPNSGPAVMSTPAAGGSGRIIAGALEQSNVDIGSEFVNLIEAQRGFQANAKVISTSDEVLRDLVNII